MSPHDSFTFPEYLALGLIVRPYGGIKAEPPDVKAEEDLPRRFMWMECRMFVKKPLAHG